MKKREGVSISKIIGVAPNDDYTLLIEFERGNKILFNMRRLIKTMPFSALNDIERFRNVTIEDKALCWYDTANPKQTLLPVRLTVDNILFTIRD